MFYGKQRNRINSVVHRLKGGVGGDLITRRKMHSLRQFQPLSWITHCVSFKPLCDIQMLFFKSSQFYVEDRKISCCHPRWRCEVALKKCNNHLAAWGTRRSLGLNIWKLFPAFKVIHLSVSVLFTINKSWGKYIFHKAKNEINRDVMGKKVKILFKTMLRYPGCDWCSHL